MATKSPRQDRSDDGLPHVSPDMKKSIDSSYNPRQDGSSPFETASVKVEEERNIWPIIWAVTAILMVLLTLYMLLG